MPLHQPKAASGEPTISVEMTEQDSVNPALDYPIEDNKLAELLNAHAANQPPALGLDFCRDIFVPHNGSKKLD